MTLFNLIFWGVTLRIVRFPETAMTGIPYFLVQITGIPPRQLAGVTIAITLFMLIISVILFVYIIYLQLKILELAPETRATFIFIDILVIVYLGVEIYREVWRKPKKRKMN